jgi:hypothetical protein
MKPEETAPLANRIGDPKADMDIKQFLLDASPRDIQKFVHLIRVDTNSRYYPLAKTALDIRLAEDAQKATEKLAQHTERLEKQSASLVRFTRALYCLTAVLAVFAIFEVVKVIFHLGDQFPKTP